MSVFIVQQHIDARYRYSNFVRPSRSGVASKRLNVLS